MKKPGDTPWDPYGLPPPGADKANYEVKKPGDTPWDPYGLPPPGADKTGAENTTQDLEKLGTVAERLLVGMKPGF